MSEDFSNEHLSDVSEEWSFAVLRYSSDPKAHRGCSCPFLVLVERQNRSDADRAIGRRAVLLT